MMKALKTKKMMMKKKKNKQKKNDLSIRIKITQKKKLNKKGEILTLFLIY